MDCSFRNHGPEKRSRKEQMEFKKICEELINCKGTIKASDVQIDQLTPQYKIYEWHKFNTKICSVSILAREDTKVPQW